MKKDVGREACLQRPDVSAAWDKLGDIFVEVLTHSGYGEIKVDVRWLSKGRKEVIISSGKQYRFVVSGLSMPKQDGSDEETKGGEE